MPASAAVAAPQSTFAYDSRGGFMSSAALLALRQASSRADKNADSHGALILAGRIRFRKIAEKPAYRASGIGDKLDKKANLEGQRVSLAPEMARSEGFEPPTLGFEGRCSIQLSYERRLVWRLGRAAHWHSAEVCAGSSGIGCPPGGDGGRTGFGLH